MKKHLVDLGGRQTPILDIVSLGRAAPRSLTPAQRELIVRTVNRLTALPQAKSYQ
jgi:hypothetical protein